MQISGAPLAAAPEAIRKARGALLGRQHAEGYWCGELTAGTALESDYILLQLWLYPPSGGVWNPPARPVIEKAVRAILERQLPDGGFNIYPLGPSEVSATIKAYFSLKLAGVSADEPCLARARQRTLELGGLQAANSLTRLNLSLFGLYPREHVPALPPEIMLWPGNFLYQMPGWTRNILVPLSIISASRPTRPVPEGFHLDELVLPGVPFALARASKFLSGQTALRILDRLARAWERIQPKSLRSLSIRKAENWILERTRHSEGLGAIYPSMMYSIMALDALGYASDHPARQEALHHFDRLLVDDGERFFFRPCFSPVRDTSLTAFSLGREGGDHPALRRAADWLLSKEVRRKGDWSVKRPGVEPGGWYFQFANEAYPDIDDTSMVLLALRQIQATDGEAQSAAIRRGLDWLLAMQSKDGGWAAFDADNNNAMLDGTCPDITGRVLEALCAFELDRSNPAIERGIQYLIRTQEQEGSWYGRWGVNYIYGTYLALRGLRAAGESDREVHILRAGEWLRSVQNADGGWGESCASYDSGIYSPGASTASQTAWAILGLIASGDPDSISVRHGIEYLVRTQHPDGCWQEDLATGTGVPRVFYLVYPLYGNTFPLLALSDYLETRRNESSTRPQTDAG
ncbi:MAG: squalene--hopene cyclase [Acidobacteria bacterium]|nr:squalene--hopene cyclase [Acidobacteriota bacterium]